MLAIDVSGSMKATDVAPTRLDAAKDAARSFVAQLPDGIRVGVVVVRLAPAVTLVQPTDDRDALDRGDRPARAARRDGHGRRAHAGPRHRRGHPGGGRRRCDAGRRRRPRARRIPTPSDDPAAAPGDRRSTSPTRSRSSRRSSCRTAPTRSARPSRSMPPSAPPRSACRSTRSPWARPTAGSRSRTSSASRSRSTCRRTPRRSPRSPRSRARPPSTRRPADDLRAVYDNLESRLGFDRRAAGGHGLVRRRGPRPRRPRRRAVGRLVRPPALGGSAGQRAGVRVRRVRYGDGRRHGRRGPGPSQACPVDRRANDRGPEARRRFIVAHTRLEPCPFVPEVRLHVGGEAMPLWEAAALADPRLPVPPPYWAWPWAGGQVLARYVLDHPGLVHGRRVADIGAGGGVVAIAAALAGAAEVTAVDIEPYAIEAARLNAAANGVTLMLQETDPIGSDDGWDVVLAGDVWYESELADRMGPWLRALAGARGAGADRRPGSGLPAGERAGGAGASSRCRPWWTWRTSRPRPCACCASCPEARVAERVRPAGPRRRRSRRRRRPPLPR